MHNLPFAVRAAAATGQAHPRRYRLAIGACAAAVQQAVGKGNVAAGFDVPVADLENHVALAHLHAVDPVLAVDGLADETQGTDGIERNDVIGIERQDGMAETSRLTTAFDQLSSSARTSLAFASAFTMFLL